MVKHPSIAAYAGILLLVIAASIFAGCASRQPAAIQTQTPSRPYQTVPTPEYLVTTVPALSGTSEVMMLHNDFEPLELVVMNGTTVTWTNGDDRECSVVSDTGSGVTFQSGTLSKGGTFSFTFTRPGTYHYHSAIPPEIMGVIIVI